MAANFEEEQLESLKRWWNDYGKFVVAGVVIGLGSFLGWSQYQSYQQKKAAEASALFQSFIEVTSEFDDGLTQAEREEAQRLAQQVRDQSGNRLYGNFADLYLAKLAVDTQDYDTARRLLETVVGRASNEAIRDLASLRLARVHAVSGDTDRALAILGSNPAGAYAAAFAEARGDVLLSLGRVSEAHSAYQAALQALGGAQTMRHSLVLLKLDNTRTSDTSDALPLPLTNPHGAVAPQGADAGLEGV